MSEQFINFFLEEISKIVFRCKNCNAEIHVEWTLSLPKSCPCCNNLTVDFEILSLRQLVSTVNRLKESPTWKILLQVKTANNQKKEKNELQIT